MKARTFRNLDVRIIKAGAGYVASIDTPDGQRALTSFNLSLDEYELKYYVSQVTRGPSETRRGLQEPPHKVAEKFGATLFDAVFSGDVRDYLEASMNQSSTEQGLRLRLDLQGAPDLAALPWEYLYHPERGLFLALSPDTALVRYVQVAEPPAPLQVKPPLRILAVACSPKDQEPLDLVKERQGLERALGKAIQCNIATVDWLPQNSLAALTQAVDNQAYHIFHFVGHGAFVEEDGLPTGFLIFEDKDGYSTQVNSRDLGWVLRRSVKLAVINACESARGQAADPSTGVASSLILQGIPAVIAMQFQVTDTVASKFAELLYGSLALGLPVDTAVTAARRGIMAEFQGSAEWGTPTLFLRAPNGQIFDIAAEAINTMARTTRTAPLRELVTDLNDRIELPDVVQQIGFRVGAKLSMVKDELPKLGQAEKADTETLYRQAREMMEAERWHDASNLFARINSIAPGYRDIAQLWLQSQEQAQLATTYKHLVTNYASGNWQRVVSDGEAILARMGDYKDTRTLYVNAQAKLAASIRPAPSKPTHLPPPARPANTGTAAGSTPPRPAPRPSTLPGQPRAGGKPADLPGPSNRSDKPSNLPN